MIPCPSGPRAAILTLGLLASAFAAAQQTVTGSFTHDGAVRDYRVYLPPGWSAGGAALPLILNLHGRGSDGLEQQTYSGMNAVADTAGFVVAYPDGLGREWNVGWAFNRPTDDVGFLVRLVDTLAARYGLDRARVYSCGMSNGGFMSYRLACAAAGRFAAVGSVTGGMAPGQIATCDPAVPVPAMHVHGTADGVVAYGGFPFVAEPADSVAAFWARVNGCQARDTVAVPDRDPGDGIRTQLVRWGDCAAGAGARTELWRVEGGTHTWPGAAFSPAGTTQDFSASAELWRFFSAFRQNAVPTQDPRAAPAVARVVYDAAARVLRLYADGPDRVRVEVYAASGRLVTAAEVAPGGGSVPLPRLARGVYAARAANGAAAARFVVR